MAVKNDVKPIKYHTFHKSHPQECVTDSTELMKHGIAACLRSSPADYAHNYTSCGQAGGPSEQGFVSDELCLKLLENFGEDTMDDLPPLDGGTCEFNVESYESLWQADLAHEGLVSTLLQWDRDECPKVQHFGGHMLAVKNGFLAVSEEKVSVSRRRAISAGPAFGRGRIATEC
eukprot:TRINITY_DN44193_c0_g1_i1.p1 TRINITY_DN44193_c0_g1~~TRINITY_DN44193_c0_g1_i1.p1  ORF type:complete len:174 (+),score=26.16 TRINITY_DN44193_c0_g1_i1:129-650(+)